MSRQSDAVARLGGETFGVLLAGVDEAGARAVADKLAAAARSAVPPDVEVDVALGLAGLGVAEDAPDAAMRAAERALASALRAGPRRAG
jgi:PleD family two-component response regulator